MKAPAIAMVTVPVSLFDPDHLFSALGNQDLPPTRAALRQLMNIEQPGIAADLGKEIDARWGQRLDEPEVGNRYGIAACELGIDHPPMIERCVTALQQSPSREESSHQAFKRIKHLTEAVLRHGSQEQVTAAFQAWAPRLDASDTVTIISWDAEVLSELVRISASRTATASWPAMLTDIVRAEPTDGPLGGAQLGFSFLQFELGHDEPLGLVWAQAMATGTTPPRRGDAHPVPLAMPAGERAGGLMRWCERQIARDQQVIADHPAILGAVTSLALTACLPGTTSVAHQQEAACRVLGLLAQGRPDRT
jgi:hypothetical protein